MAQLSLVQFSTDDAFYGALKAHVYGTVYDTVLEALRSGNTTPLRMAQNGSEGLSVKIGRFTARKANNLFVPDGGPANASAEFFGFTSHKVREKLSDLAEDETIEKVGRGLRDAKEYNWNETIEKYQLCSYLAFRKATGSDTSLGLEVYRILQTFGDDVFEANDFIEAYQAVHEEEYSQSRWGKRKFQEIAESYEYKSYLKDRLKALAEQDLVDVRRDKGTFQLNEDGHDAAHHFGLFIDEVPYKASWNMCQDCPARSLCWDLQVTDLVLDAIRGEPTGSPETDGTRPMTNGSNNGTG
jgi:hypothetical protein